jgi:hypothetical protein
VNHELSFDYEDLMGQSLKKALGTGQVVCDDGSRAYDNLWLVFDRSTLRIGCTEETDEIVVDLIVEDNPFGSRNGRSVSSFDRYIGEELGWSWMATNYRGYNDMLALSFSGLKPQVVLISMASQVSIYAVTTPACVPHRAKQLPRAK